MKAIRLRNYRSLEDTDFVDIRPLTFLLGANSTGKSSFLKIFPLLKQSSNTSVQGTFLWNGSLVDMKDFKNVVRNGEGDIIIDFDLRNVRFFSIRSWVSNKFIESCKVTLTISAKDERWDYLKVLEISNNHFCVRIEYSNEKNNKVSSLSINGDDYTDLRAGIYYDGYFRTIPRIVYKIEKSYYDEHIPFQREVADLLASYDKVRRFNERRLFTELSLALINGQNIEEVYYGITQTEWNKGYDELIRISRLCLYSNINLLIDSLNSYLVNLASHITYVAPLRANFERYYRFQNYSVNTIDADGRNLAMFLNSLDPNTGMQSFNDWLSKVFKFEVKITPSVGHVAIEMKEKGKEFRNLVDLGFGYTEMLPILAMIWKDIVMDNNSKNDDGIPHIFAIEQPELHLHPRFQAKFANMLCNVINEVVIVEKRDVRFVIETHSEVIINKIGQLICEHELQSTLTNVVIFNAKQEGLNKYVVPTSYTEDGYIIDWPYGFFEEEDDVD